MKRLRFLLALFASCTAMHAQSGAGLWLGATVGYDYGVPLAIEREPGVINRYDYNGLGSSFDHTLLAAPRVIHSGLFGRRWGLSCMPGLRASNGSFTSNDFFINPLFPSLGQQRFEVHSTISAVHADARISFSLMPGLGLQAGLFGSYRLFSSVAQKLVDPTGVAPDRIVATGDPITASAFRAGPVLSGYVSTDLAENIALYFEPTIRADLDALIQGIGFRSFTAGLSVSLMVRQQGAKTSPLDPAPTHPADKAPMNVDVRLSAGDGTEGQTVTIRRQTTSKRVIIPFLPFVPFDSGSADMQRYVSALPAADAASFTVNALARRQPVELLPNMVNVIACRLRLDTASRIFLTGMSLAGEPGDIAGARAARLKSYLTDVWGIAPGRVIVGTSHADGHAGVMLGGTSATVSQPVVVEWKEQEYVLPRLNVRKRIEPAGSVASAVTTLRQGDRVVGRYYGQEDNAASGFELSMPLEKNAPPAPLIAELIVRDSAGAVSTARDQLLFTIAPDTATAPDAQETTFLYLYGGTVIEPEPGSRGLVEKELKRCLKTSRQLTLSAFGNQGNPNYSYENAAKELMDAVKNMAPSVERVTLLRLPANTTSNIYGTITGFGLTVVQ